MQTRGYMNPVFQCVHRVFVFSIFSIKILPFFIAIHLIVSPSFRSNNLNILVGTVVRWRYSLTVTFVSSIDKMSSNISIMALVLSPSIYVLVYNQNLGAIIRCINYPLNMLCFVEKDVRKTNIFWYYTKSINTRLAHIGMLPIVWRLENGIKRNKSNFFLDNNFFFHNSINQLSIDRKLDSNNLPCNYSGLVRCS